MITAIETTEMKVKAVAITAMLMKMGVRPGLTTFLALRLMAYMTVNDLPNSDEEMRSAIEIVLREIGHDNIDAYRAYDKADPGKA